MRGRNLLNAKTVVAGAAAYALLTLSIIAHVGDTALLAASTFYIVGVIAGFLPHLYDDEQSQATVDDYGLASARTMRTLLFSGIAAVGAVVLVVMLPGAVNDQQLQDTVAATAIGAVAAETPATSATVASTTATVVGVAPTAVVTPASPPGSATSTTAAAPATLPPATATVATATVAGVTTSAAVTPASPPDASGGAPGTSQAAIQQPVMSPTPTVDVVTRQFPPLSNIFDLDKNRFGIVIAAVFGFAPEALLVLLKQESDRVKGQLASTSAAEKAPPAKE